MEKFEQIIFDDVLKNVFNVQNNKHLLTQHKKSYSSDVKNCKQCLS